MGTWSIGHWIIVLLIVVVLFGAGKIPLLMGDMAKGVKAFKKGMRDDDDTAAGEADAGAKALRSESSHSAESSHKDRDKVANG